MAYQCAENFDNEAGFFNFTTTAIVDHIKPPKSQGLQYTEWETASDGTLVPKGDPFVIWDWEDIEKAEYDAMLTSNGLTWDPADASGEVTIDTLYDRATPSYARYNCVVIHRKGVDSFWDAQRKLYTSVRFTYRIVSST